MQDEIRTDRLVLRHFTPDDAPRVKALVGNWKVARMLARVPYPYDDGMAEGWIATHRARRAAREGFAYAIAEKGELVGTAGLDRAGDAYELGYWIGEPYWGRGIATEAGKALLHWAFAALPVERLTASHLVENHASGRVLTKLGFRYIAEAQIWSEARQENLRALRMELRKSGARAHVASESETAR